MSEGLLKKRILDKLICVNGQIFRVPKGTEIDNANYTILSVSDVIDEMKKDFELSEDEEFILEEYGYEQLSKLTHGAIKLKLEILVKVVKQYRETKKKWLGDEAT